MRPFRVNPGIHLCSWSWLLYWVYWGLSSSASAFFVGSGDIERRRLHCCMTRRRLLTESNFKLVSLAREALRKCTDIMRLLLQRRKMSSRQLSVAEGMMREMAHKCPATIHLLSKEITGGGQLRNGDGSAVRNKGSCRTRIIPDTILRPFCKDHISLWRDPEILWPGPYIDQHLQSRCFDKIRFGRQCSTFQTLARAEIHTVVVAKAVSAA